MIAAIAAWLVSAKVSKRAARPIAWVFVLVLAALLVAGIASIWLGRHDRAVVAADRSQATITVLSNTIAAQRKAGAAKDARDRAFAEEQTNLQEKADAAAGDGASPLDAVLDGMR